MKIRAGNGWVKMTYRFDNFSLIKEKNLNAKCTSNVDKWIKLEYQGSVIIIRVKVFSGTHHSTINKYTQINYDVWSHDWHSSQRKVQMEYVLHNSRRMLSQRFMWKFGGIPVEGACMPGRQTVIGWEMADVSIASSAIAAPISDEPAANPKAWSGGLNITQSNIEFATAGQMGL